MDHVKIFKCLITLIQIQNITKYVFIQEITEKSNYRYPLKNNFRNILQQKKNLRIYF